MKAKPKANEKGKVTFDARKPAKMAWEAFSFERWTDADLHPPLVTMESKIAEFVETARREAVWSAESKADGKPEEALRLAEMANENRAKAAKWRKLSSLPKPEGERLDWQCYKDLAEGVDFLIARSGQSDSASIYLSMVIGDALRGLHALAAHEKGASSALLIDCLLDGVTSFELLGWHRPQLFTHYTLRLALIPATISPQSGNAEECRELMGKLKVGEKSIYSVTGKEKRRWTQKTRANDLAVRLVGYIDNKRRDSKMFAGSLEVFDNFPEWFPTLTSLEEFGKETWPDWAEIAWRILDDGRHPALYKKETRICDESKRDGGKMRVWPADVKKALRNVFRTIATGKGRRKCAGDTPPNVP